MNSGRAVNLYLNDLHVASPSAVSPARWLLPPNATEWRPNPLQEKINEHYLECWDTVKQLRKGARLIVNFVGDLNEGLHHDAKDVITNYQNTQEDMAVAVIETGLKRAGFHIRKGDTMRFVGGSPAHDGAGLESFRRIARALLDIDKQDGTDHVKIYDEYTVNGVRFAAMHKPGSGPGSRAQTIGNAFQAWLKSLYLKGLERGVWPRYVMTAHYHTFLRRTVHKMTPDNDDVVMTGYILPSFKIPDNYIKSVEPSAWANIGMVAFDITLDGRVAEHDMRITVRQDEVETL